ncbi:MAG: hypothetical protein V4733_04535 [Verrucomicrobiota bacterium]
MNNRYTRGLLVILVGAAISALPLIWPLATDQYDPHYGKFPLWILANCGVIALSAAYCGLMVIIFERWRWLWIPLLGFLLVPVALLAGFAFWALGIFLIPVGPVLLLIAGLITIQSKKSEQGAGANRLSAGGSV